MSTLKVLDTLYSSSNMKRRTSNALIPHNRPCRDALVQSYAHQSFTSTSLHQAFSCSPSVFASAQDWSSSSIRVAKFDDQDDTTCRKRPESPSVRRYLAQSGTDNRHQLASVLDHSDRGLPVPQFFLPESEFQWNGKGIMT
jgi:hypothetical protein